MVQELASEYSDQMPKIVVKAMGDNKCAELQLDVIGASLNNALHCTSLTESRPECDVESLSDAHMCLCVDDLEQARERNDEVSVQVVGAAVALAHLLLWFIRVAVLSHPSSSMSQSNIHRAGNRLRLRL